MPAPRHLGWHGNAGLVLLETIGLHFDGFIVGINQLTEVCPRQR
jgi:hypothetical protein